MTITDTNEGLQRYVRVARALHDEVADHPWRTEVGAGPDPELNGEHEVRTCACDFAPYLDAAAVGLGAAARALDGLMIGTPVADIEALAPVHGSDDPDDGHTFFVNVRSQMASKVKGDPHNSDADWVDADGFMIGIRASNLPAALRRAALAPLGAWARRGLVGATDEPVPPREAIVHPLPDRPESDRPRP